VVGGYWLRNYTVKIYVLGKSKQNFEQRRLLMTVCRRTDSLPANSWGPVHRSGESTCFRPEFHNIIFGICLNLEIALSLWYFLDSNLSVFKSLDFGVSSSWFKKNNKNHLIKNSWLTQNIFFGRLCHHRELRSTDVLWQL
jgi:hypothetical protein